MKIPSDFSQNVAKFSEILVKFNKVHSLTNYKNLNEQVQDSIKPLDFLDLRDIKIAIDVGSGAGFPAIFLAMILKDCKWHLFEPNIKKSSFLSFVKASLSLENLVIHSQKIELAEKFHAELITSRALMKTKDLINLCNGFYDEKTKFLLYKGSSVSDELTGLKAEIYNEKNRNYVVMDGIC
ncbi:16S rRNA (guanine(527)-N(7))-methyltransferase RsmG [Campylobacter suis]|uniref:Ribosomal RNA small subunit methyltransferase G n=1 Tax=Campylobacter suis TaxID=2790657 RepID=A0ABM8Q6P5_9BACT|nr:16S rRNA (guanine(527)-N(7))-methyltransferase RsmG [Campylobacter suis]CAD7288495.1 Ribosomal RNA small subunit methyltransferase G [Campylobacter suis]